METAEKPKLKLTGEDGNVFFIIVRARKGAMKMVYSQRYIYPTKYVYAGVNQHGDRYKIDCTPKVNVVVLSAKFDDAKDLAILIYLSSQLGVPITWKGNTTPQTAEIEVVSVDALRQLE